MVDIPLVGIWHADVETDGETELSGRVTIVLSDQTFVGTIVSGGVRNGRGRWKVVGGNGGWSNTIPKRGYNADQGVRKSLILQDAASECGETLGGTIPSDAMGPHFVREEASASNALALVDAWYMSNDGITTIGARATSTYSGQAVVAERDNASGFVSLTTDLLAGLVPGATIDGIAVVDVRYVLEKSALKVFGWGELPSNQWRTLILKALPWLRYQGIFEYRVVTQETDRLNLQCVRSSAKMPDLKRVPYSPGVPGIKANALLGSSVYVAFVNSDPSMPMVVGFAPPDSPGFIPLTMTMVCPAIAITSAAVAVSGALSAGSFASAAIAPPLLAAGMDIGDPLKVTEILGSSITLGGGSAAVARVGDTVSVVVGGVPGTGTITSGNTAVLA
jgi:hypothetical protein